MTPHRPEPPDRVRVPVMRHRWETLTFLHWAYPINAVQSLLPRGLTAEAWDGRAWVGLVPFHMTVRPPVGPGTIPFPETNVRTYVTGPNGETGVWFFSLDATSAAAVTAARSLYGLPYRLAAMDVEREEGTVIYRSRRRRAPSVGAGHHIVVEPAETLAADRLGEFDHYLTARFRLWAVHAGALLTTPAEHPPWTLRRGRVVRLEQNLIEAAGLPAPSGEPLVHFSEGVDVRIGPPRLVRRR